MVICSFKAQKTGIGMCRKGKCEGCKFYESEKSAQSKSRKMKSDLNVIGSGSVRRPKTCEYLRLKIQQKQAHIVREQERVAILKELLEEQERT